MRISTSQMYQNGAASLMDGQSSLYKLQNQLSTGKKFLSAQEDPVGAALVLLNSQSLAVNKQYADNQATASSHLQLEETQQLAAATIGIEQPRRTAAHATALAQEVGPIFFVGHQLFSRFQAR